MKTLFLSLSFMAWPRTLYSEQCASRPATQLGIQGHQLIALFGAKYRTPDYRYPRRRYRACSARKRYS
jgi:hypothetical protein